MFIQPFPPRFLVSTSGLFKGCLQRLKYPEYPVVKYFWNRKMKEDGYIFLFFTIDPEYRYRQPGYHHPFFFFFQSN